MLRRLLVIGSAVCIAGCAAEVRPLGTPNKDEAAMLASYAAKADPPAANMVIRPDKDAVRVGAVVDKDSGAIRLYNFSDQVVDAGNIWLNGTYVHQVGALPAMGSIRLNRADFYDKTGQSFASSKLPVDSIVIQSTGTKGRAFSVLGMIEE